MIANPSLLERCIAYLPGGNAYGGVDRKGKKHFNLFPAANCIMPFASYGNTEYVIKMAFVGMILSVWRRNNLILYEKDVSSTASEDGIVRFSDGKLTIGKTKLKISSGTRYKRKVLLDMKNSRRKRIVYRFMGGVYDYTVNYNLQKQYYNVIEAPVKAFYTFGSSAHSPLFEEPEHFINIMLDDIVN